jgi:hypothetical protein
MEHGDLDALIVQLDEMLGDQPSRGYWSAVWALVRSIGSGFKGTRYPTRADHDAAWNRFQGLVEKARSRSEEAKRETEARRVRSTSARDQVERKAAGARLITPGEHAIAEIILFPLTLIKRIIEDLFNARPDQLEEIRGQLAHANERLQEAWAIFKDRKSDMLAADRNRAYESLQEAREQLDRAWAQWKGAKAVAREQKHREWLEREAQREQRAERHRDFVRRVEANIAKLEEKLDRARAAFEKQESHLDDLRSQYANAWSDGFRDRCSEWIDEGEARLASIRESIDKMEGWLDEERAKLG